VAVSVGIVSDVVVSSHPARKVVQDSVTVAVFVTVDVWEIDTVTLTEDGHTDALAGSQLDGSDSKVTSPFSFTLLIRA
jgi:hypothetical protein